MNNLPSTDVAILDLLRKTDSMSISEFEAALQVTATAVRQRLNRLLAKGWIEREAVQTEGRGRPSHNYRLTDDGRRQTGANFADLAIALWKEIRAISDPEIQRGLLKRISERLADIYRTNILGEDVETKMRAIADLFGHREVPFEVETKPGQELPVLNALACPYPELADQDRSICSMERMLFSELLGEKLRLSQCRLDGAACCSFEVN